MRRVRLALLCVQLDCAGVQAVILPNGTIVMVYRADSCGGSNGGEALGTWPCAEFVHVFVLLRLARAVGLCYRVGLALCMRSPNPNLVLHAGIAVADHWSSNFTRDPEPIVAPSMPMTHGSDNEDPFMWTESDGSWHIVNHQQGAKNVCGGDGAGASAREKRSVRQQLGAAPTVDANNKCKPM